MVSCAGPCALAACLKPLYVQPPVPSQIRSTCPGVARTKQNAPPMTTRSAILSREQFLFMMLFLFSQCVNSASGRSEKEKEAYWEEASSAQFRSVKYFLT